MLLLLALWRPVGVVQRRDGPPRPRLLRLHEAVGVAALVGRADVVHGVLAAGVDAGDVGGVRREAGGGGQAQPQLVGRQDG